MKNSAEYAKKLNKLCTSLKKSVKDAADLVDKTIPREPATILLLGCVSEFTSVKEAHLALARLKAGFVDYNELRVSRPREIVKTLGKKFPNADVVVDRIIQVLNSVFNNNDGLDMAGIDDMGKRDAQAVIKDIEGITPYIYSFFIMYYIEAHAFPLNENMYKVLQEEDVVNPASDFNDVHGFLERQIAAAKARETFVMLRAYCDGKAHEKHPPEEDKTKTKKAVKKAVKKTTKKTAEKDTESKAAKKTVKKKTAKKATKKTSK